MNSIDYNNLLSQFFRIEKVGTYSLQNMREVCNFFGNPQNSFKSIHIAGTNGKGSVSKMIFQMLKESGKGVGVYTSPHLLDITERFETNDGLISQETFIFYAQKILEYKGDLSYFERCVILAFLFFRDQGVEYAVIEVGLGGRLDATNIITPIISVITSIGYDHMEFLGNTLEEIAFEKGGIIKANIPVVLYGENVVLESIAHERNAPVFFPDMKIQRTNLLGKHQLHNASIAYCVGKFLGIHEDILHGSLNRIHHPGRMQYLYPNLLIDGAHNEPGLKMLRIYLEELENIYSSIEYCFNLKKGKTATLVTDIFPHIKKWNIIESKNPLLCDSMLLKKEILSLGRHVTIVAPNELLEQRKKNENTLFVFFGSLYILGEFY